MIKIRKAILQEKINQADIDQLKSEAKNFSQNILRIKDWQDLKKVFFAVKIWVDHFRDLIKYSLLGVDIDLEKTEDSILVQKIREQEWTIELELPKIFFIDIYDKSIDYDDRWILRKISDMKYENIPIELWEKIYYYWDLKRQSKYQKYSKLIRDIFEILNEFIVIKKEVMDKYIKNETHINNIFTEIYYKESDNKIETKTREISTLINNGIDILKRNKLDWVLKGLKKFLIDFTGKYINETNNLACAYYDEQKDLIGFTNLALVGNEGKSTLVHEVGHRLHTHLKKEYSDTWFQFCSHFEKNRFSFSKEDIEEIIKLFIKVNLNNSYDLHDNNYSLKIWQDMIKLSNDVILKAKMLVMIRYGEIFWMEIVRFNNSDIDSYKEYKLPKVKDRISDHFLNKKFWDKAVSEYASTNHREAFAETFLYYCMGYDIPKETLIVFLYVTGIKR